MPFELFLALRYLRSRRKRRLVRATSLAAVIGVAVGVAALVVALALANGFRDEMRNKILQGTAHLTVMRTDGVAIQDHRSVAARISQIDGVSSAVGTTYYGAVATGPKGSSYAVLRGVDAGFADPVRTWLIEGSAERVFSVIDHGEVPNVLIGAELANRTGLRVGDTAELLPAGENMSMPPRRLVRVAGVFRSGLFEYDAAWIYLSLQSAMSFAGSNAASLISVQIRDVDDVKNIGSKVKALLGTSYAVVDWQEANRPLFTALALERRMGLFIVGLIILIAMLNITTTLILVVVERRRDIAILNAMGASKHSITALFMIEGAIIGAFGAFIGMMIGLIACVVGNTYKVVSLPADVYSISNVPFRAHLSEITLAVAIAFVLSVLATIYPAQAAAKMRPADTLRDAG